MSLSEILDSFPSGVLTTALSLVIVLASVAVMVGCFREDNMSGGLAAILVGGGIVFLINGGATIVGDLLNAFLGEREEAAKPKPTPSVEPTAPPPTSAPEAPTDYSGVWSIIGIIFACIVAFILVAAGAWYLRLRLARKSAEVREKIEADKRERERKVRIRAEEIAMWERTLTTADELDARWMKYQTDLDSILQMPLMTDLGEPTVMTASRAHLDMLAARTPEAPEGATGESTFPDSVRAFTIALQAAENLARKTGLRRYNPEERKTIHRAHRILNQALGTNSEAERATCYEQVLKMLSGLVTVPKPAIAAIEASAPLLAIEAGSLIAEAPTRHEPPTPPHRSAIDRLRDSGRNLIRR